MGSNGFERTVGNQFDFIARAESCQLYTQQRGSERPSSTHFLAQRPYPPRSICLFLSRIFCVILALFVHIEKTLKAELQLTPCEFHVDIIFSQEMRSATFIGISSI
jgi:hypothetical protein